MVYESNTLVYRRSVGYLALFPSGVVPFLIQGLETRSLVESPERVRPYLPLWFLSAVIMVPQGCMT